MSTEGRVGPHRAMPRAYKGSAPTVRCHDVSGADCGSWLPLDAEHCGHQTARVYLVPTPRGELVHNRNLPPAIEPQASPGLPYITLA